MVRASGLAWLQQLAVRGPPAEGVPWVAPTGPSEAVVPLETGVTVVPEVRPGGELPPALQARLGAAPNGSDPIEPAPNGPDPIGAAPNGSDPIGSAPIGSAAGSAHTPVSPERQHQQAAAQTLERSQ